MTRERRAGRPHMFFAFASSRAPVKESHSCTKASPCSPYALRRPAHEPTHARPTSATYDLLAHSKRSPVPRWAIRQRRRMNGPSFTFGHPLRWASPRTPFTGRALPRIGALDQGVFFPARSGDTGPLTFRHSAAHDLASTPDRHRHRRDRFRSVAVKLLSFPDPKRLPSSGHLDRSRSFVELGPE